MKLKKILPVRGEGGGLCSFSADRETDGRTDTKLTDAFRVRF